MRSAWLGSASNRLAFSGHGRRGRWLRTVYGRRLYRNMTVCKKFSQAKDLQKAFHTNSVLALLTPSGLGVMDLGLMTLHLYTASSPHPPDSISSTTHSSSRQSASCPQSNFKSLVKYSATIMATERLSSILSHLSPGKNALSTMYTSTLPSYFCKANTWVVQHAEEPR